MTLVPRWRSITKRTLDLFGRWGDSRTNLTQMLDGVLPVVVVDRFRDDDEGSIFGISAFSDGAFNEHPTISFGSSVNDWELLGVTQAGVNWNLKPATFNYQIMMFTPISPYNPATTINPLGFFVSGILLDRSFTFGSVQGIGGAVAVPPVIFGPDISGPSRVAVTSSAPFQQAAGFSPWTFEPIRIFRDVTLTFMLVLNPAAGFGFAPPGMSISILYRERPKVSQGGV